MSSFVESPEERRKRLAGQVLPNLGGPLPPSVLDDGPIGPSGLSGDAGSPMRASAAPPVSLPPPPLGGSPMAQPKPPGGGASAANWVPQGGATGVQNASYQGGVGMAGAKTGQWDKASNDALGQLGKAQTQLSGSEREAGAAQSAYQKALDKKGQAETEIFNIEQDKAQEQLAMQQSFDAREQKRQAQEQIDQGKIKEKVDASEANLNSAIAEATEFGKVDPSRALSGGNAILAAISIALGGIGGALSGKGGNTGLDAVNGAIDRDIASQKEAIAGRQRNVANRQTMLGVFKEKFGNEAQAIAAARLARYTEAQHQIDMAMKQYSDPKSQAQLAQLNAGIEAEKAKAKGDYTQQSVANAQKDVALQSGVAEGANQSKMREMELAAKGLPNGGKDIPADQVAKIGEQAAILQMTNSLEQEFKNKTGPFSGLNKHFPSTNASDYEAQRTAFRQELTTFLTGAGVSGKQAEDYLDMVPEAGNWSAEGKNKFAALRNLIATKKGEAVTALKQAGYNTRALGETYEPTQSVANR